MAKIESIVVATARVPLDHVTSFATRTVSARDYALVRVRAEGVEGIGFCYAGSSGGTLVAQAVEQLLAPGLLGRESLLVEGLWQRMFEETLLHGRSGSVMRAISILDCALWDLNSRASKLPLYRYLGAAVDEAVPAYASGGYYLPGKTPKKLGAEMAGYAKAGYRTLKIKVGRVSPTEGAARAKTRRDRIGRGFELRRHRLPALVSRPARAACSGDTQRALRGVLPRRPGAQFPASHRYAAGDERRHADSAENPWPRVSVR